MRFLPAERFFAFVIVIIALADLTLINVRGIAVDWLGYALPAFAALAMIAGGQYYRIHRGEERIALALIASGLFIIFTLVASVFNYMLLPITAAPGDVLLANVDSLFGYKWPEAVAFVAEWPAFSRTLYYVYFSSLPQLAFVVLLLGFSGKADALWHFLLTGVLGVAGCIAIWFAFPTFGPSTLFVLSPDLLSRIELGVTPQYGEELLRLSREGPTYISPANVLGLIGFPSFHTVMACMSVVFLARFRWVFPFALCLNAMMVPAILVHGGHHLSDVVGGIAMFAVVYLLGGKLVARLAQPDGPGRHPEVTAPPAIK
ncbi:MULTISPECIES: phosphatase PAP2 family protein [unclassified Rhizobium]|uniref:phosphatase PAP2 family protein n=1 Tax=unclassified Rhizobium TaxID=2613769 RepID=UPI0017847C12|nr:MULTISPECIES: phosphatase PAP2 family protein [unclassified Rhizobium]MBD8688989.1 phosphatase PAP2 family protein [Rhizobium sp. CFBP 13644]MBD8693457.1 phosphatase PAP2 family protein [Rhizobium sp. CFBP 13717]